MVKPQIICIEDAAYIKHDIRIADYPWVTGANQGKAGVKA
jgi:hypothetical protein